jgi:hypothetical protein
VVILPDADPEGESYAAAVLCHLARLRPRPRVRVVRLADLWRTTGPVPEGGDIKEWLDRGVPDTWDDIGCRAELDRVADAAPAVDLDEPEPAAGPEPVGTDAGGPRDRETQAQALLRLAGPTELTRTDDGRAFARLPVGGHHENHEIRSPGFRRWLTREFYREKAAPPSADALQGALGVLEARAHFDGATEPVYVRVAPGDGGVLIDLGDVSWRAVRIGPGGWALIDRPRVRFRRPSGLRPLPTPAPGATVQDLRRYDNVTDADFLLLVAWLTVQFCPGNRAELLLSYPLF